MNSNKNPWKYFWLGILILATLTTTAVAARANGNRQPNLRERFTADNSTRFVRVDASIVESGKTAYLGWPITNLRWWPSIWKVRAANRNTRLMDKSDYRDVREQQFANLRGNERPLIYKNGRLGLQRNGREYIRLAKELRERQAEVRINDRNAQFYATRISRDAGSAVRTIRTDRETQVARSATSDLRRLNLRFERTPDGNGLSSERVAHNRSNRDARQTEADV